MKVKIKANLSEEDGKKVEELMKILSPIYGEATVTQDKRTGLTVVYNV